MVFIIWCFWRTNGLWNGSPWRQSAELAANALYAFVSVIVLFYHFPTFFIVIKYVVTSPSEDGCCQIKRKKKGGGGYKVFIPHSFFHFLIFPILLPFYVPFLSVVLLLFLGTPTDAKKVNWCARACDTFMTNNLRKKYRWHKHRLHHWSSLRITLITGKEQETHRLHPFHRGKRVSVVCYYNTCTFARCARVTRLYRFGAPFTNVMSN